MESWKNQSESWKGLGKVTEFVVNINICFTSVLQQEGRRCKDKGIRLYQAHKYNQAIVSLGLAKEFLPRSMNEFHAQLQSYLASCYFSLQQYPEALEAGKEAYKIRPGRAQVSILHCLHWEL